MGAGSAAREAIMLRGPQHIGSPISLAPTRLQLLELFDCYFGQQYRPVSPAAVVLPITRF